MERAVLNAILLVILAGSGSFIVYRAVTWEPATDSLEVTENETTNETNVTYHPCFISPSPNGTRAWTGYTMAGLPESEWNNTTDWDGDNISDEDEILFGTEVCNWDTDNDTVSDFIEVFELFTDPLDNDTDNDTLTDAVDPAPLNASHDADGDGVLDQYDQWMTMAVVRNLVFEWNWTGLQVVVDFILDDVLLTSIFEGSDANGSFTVPGYDWPDNYSRDPVVNFTIDGGGLNESSHALLWAQHPNFLLGAGRLTYHYTGSRGNLTIEVNH